MLKSAGASGRPGGNSGATNPARSSQFSSTQFFAPKAKFDQMRQPGSLEARRHAEGCTARAIENQTARLPSDVFLWSAMGVAGVSCMLHCSGDHEDSRFFGQWVAPLLILGLYNKLVKVHGSDRLHEGE